MFAEVFGVGESWKRDERNEVCGDRSEDPCMNECFSFISVSQKENITSSHKECVATTAFLVFFSFAVPMWFGTADRNVLYKRRH